MNGAALSWRAAWRIASRDLSARFRGLRLLLVCLFLGVGALSAIGTLTAAIDRELAARGRAILGGDIAIEVWQRTIDAGERATLEGLGTLSSGTRLQAMASTANATAPVELKAVDGAYPLVGHLRLSDGRSVGAPPEGTAWLSRGAADRLDVGPGDRLRIGTGGLRVDGIIAEEPDRLGEGFTFGPTVIVGADFPVRAGLLAPGAMYRSKYRVAFNEPRDPEEVADALKRRFPSSGFEIRTRARAAPGAERFITRMGDFLTLVGLAALVIAGIGIAGGVSSYLEARRNNIATLKVLGATSADIARIYALQLGATALVGSLGGLGAGLVAAPLLGMAIGELLPVTADFTFAPRPLLMAMALGLLVALIFSAPPLASARHFPAMALMRARVSPMARGWREAAWPVAGGAGALIAIILLSADQRLLSGGFMLGAMLLLGLLALLGTAIRMAARHLRHPRARLLRHALANLHRPGAQTVGLVAALGFGLSAFVALAGIQTSLAGNIERRVPSRAPDYFMLDVPREKAGELRELVHAHQPAADIRTVPALRGAILAYGPKDRMVRVADLKEIPDDAWPLRGERGLTYSDALPEGNVLTQGGWWPAAYRGEPLVSVDAELGQVLGLRIGDYVTIGLLGVERQARIASFRRIDWDSMGFNHVLVFSPNALADAPHNLAATIDLPPGVRKGELLRELVREFPSSSVIEVGGVLAQAQDLLKQVSAAIVAAASVAVLAGLAVLTGAIAAARAARTYDTVILRVLGASRRQILLMQMAEYGLLAMILAAAALVIGSTIAWAVVTMLFDFDWLPDWWQVLGVLAAGLAMILGFALAGTLPLLRAKPASALREL